MEAQNTPKPKRNLAISYIKGIAIVFVMLIHVLDWGDTPMAPIARMFKQILYPGVVFFMATVGSVVYIAYNKYDDLKKPTKRLLSRGFQLIGVYYLYNIIKFTIFDFDIQSFYYGFRDRGMFTLQDIVSLKSFAVPIPILVTIGLFLIISPLFLWIVKRTKYPHGILLSILAISIFVNYFIPLPQNSLTDFFYARGNITFAILLWFVPYLIGFYIAYLGFEKQKKKLLPLFLVLSIPAIWYAQKNEMNLQLEHSLHPLRLHAITVSFALMFGFIYLFDWFEKLKRGGVNTILAGIRLLGDYTLWLYIAHWVVIDITIWIFHPHTYLVWLTVPILLIGFLVWKRKKLKEYNSEYNLDK